MSSSLSPALAAFANGRWPDDRGMAQRQRYPLELDQREVDLRDLDARLEPPLHPSELDRLEREPASASRWLPVAFIRFMVFFFVGVAATLAWQSYGNAARRLVAGLAPGLGWLAPPPAAPSASGASAAAGASPDQLAAVSRSLAAVRQSVEKLAADVTKLQPARPDPAPARTSGSPAAAPPPAAAATTQPRKPVAQAASTR